MAGRNGSPEYRPELEPDVERLPLDIPSFTQQERWFLEGQLGCQICTLNGNSPRELSDKHGLKLEIRDSNEALQFPWDMRSLRSEVAINISQPFFPGYPGVSVENGLKHYNSVLPSQAGGCVAIIGTPADHIELGMALGSILKKRKSRIFRDRLFRTDRSGWRLPGYGWALRANDQLATSYTAAFMNLEAMSTDMVLAMMLYVPREVAGSRYLR